MVEFDELVVIYDCSHEHYGANNGSTWVVDSGVYFHVMLHTRSFTTYEGGNFSVVKMRNYDKSKVIVVGDVRVVTNLGYNLILKNSSCSRFEDEFYVSW